MDVTYKPEGGEAQSWNFQAGEVTMTEAERIEQHAGCVWDEWVNRLQSGSARARRVLLWHLMRRQHPMLRYEDTPDFRVSELSIEYDAVELQRMLDGLDSLPADDDTKATVRSTIEAELEKAKDRSAPKASTASNDSDSATA